MTRRRCKCRNLAANIRCFGYVCVMISMIFTLNIFIVHMYTLSNATSKRHVYKAPPVRMHFANVYHKRSEDYEHFPAEDEREIFFQKNRSSKILVENVGVHSRPEKCDGCFRYQFKNILSSQKICNLTSSNMASKSTIDVLILITTTHKKVHTRNVIRRTWISYSMNNTQNVRYAFLLGRHKGDPRWEAAIEAENDEWQDIIKDDFIDSYKNLTYKTIMGLRWSVTHCRHAKYVMKTDDDVYVNIRALLYDLKKHGVALQTAVGGRCPNMAFPNRFPLSKWYVDFNTYPKSSYPKYCSGTGYVMSMRVAHDIVHVSADIPFFPIEDVYIAFCINKLSYRFESINSFHGVFVIPLDCNYKGLGIATSHGVTEKWMENIWNEKCH